MTMKIFRLEANNKIIIVFSLFVILVVLFTVMSSGCKNNSSENTITVSDGEKEQQNKQHEKKLDSMHLIYGSLADIKIELIFGNSKEIIDIDLIADWLDVKKNGNVYSYTVNDEKLNEYTKKLSDKYSNYKSYITFTASDGEEKTIENKSTGWIFDDSYAAEILRQYIDDCESVTVRLTDKSAESKRWGVRISSDYDTEDKKGDSYAEVSIDAQHMWVYKNGKLILESDIITGSPGSNDTPTGYYYIYQKKHPATLYGPGYETEVSYWMAFNDDIGFHDAVWQDNFGGNEYVYNGSHGCVNLSLSVAEKLYKISYVNMPVYIY